MHALHQAALPRSGYGCVATASTLESVAALKVPWDGCVATASTLESVAALKGPLVFIAVALGGVWAYNLPPKNTRADKHTHTHMHKRARERTHE
jgi:hypothetical protein